MAFPHWSALHLSTLLCMAPLAAAAQTATRAAPVPDGAVIPEAATSASATADESNRVVITGSRAPTALKDEPQRIEVVSQHDIARTPQRELADALKKNTSVDLIQYPAQLAGIGVRGFGPQFSGINQRTLLLVDGLPAMTDNLSTLGTQDVEQIELLKGPASALYGSQAMGGVLNLVTRRTTSGLDASITAGAGTMGAREVSGRAGGAPGERFNFDYAGGWRRMGDFTMGNGERRPYSGYTVQNHSLRLGAQLAPGWTLDWRGDMYRGKGIQNPGDLGYGSAEQGSKDLTRYGQRVTLQGRVGGSHTLSASVFAGKQSATNYTVASRYDPPGTRYPYRTYEGDLSWRGAQIRDVWQWADNARLVYGADWERAQADSRRYSHTGEAQAPYSANNRRSNLGAYAQQEWRWNDDATVLNLGARYDRIRVETLATPLKTDFAPGSAGFNKFSPSAGLRQKLGGGWNLHGSYGEGFITPDAFQLTGKAVQVRGAQTTITQGNPGLKPESSRTWDMGAGWENDQWQLDATYFSTRVRDKITSVLSVDTPALKQTDYVNAAKARMNGLELAARWRFAPGWALSAGGTHYFKTEEYAVGKWTTVNNVPKQSWRVALDGSYGAWSGRLGVRYVGNRYDTDWIGTSPSYMQKVLYKPYTVADLSVRYRIDRQQALRLSVDNLTNKFYWEKYGFPQPGRQFKLAYTWEMQ